MELLCDFLRASNNALMQIAVQLRMKKEAIDRIESITRMRITKGRQISK